MAKQSKKTKQIRVKKPLWGKFNLPYPVGSSPKIEEKLADELIDAGFAISEDEAKKLDAGKAKENEEADEDQD